MPRTGWAKRLIMRVRSGVGVEDINAILPNLMNGVHQNLRNTDFEVFDQDAPW